MAENSKAMEVTSAADEWDILSLTSSVYTAPIFRRGFDTIYLPGYGDVNQQDTYSGLVMSDGFVFPPSEHENLPIEPEHDELNTSKNGKEGKEGSCSGDNDDCCHVEPEEVEGISDEDLSSSNDLLSTNETTFTGSNPSKIHAKQDKDHTTCKCDLPRAGWWKRKSTCLFHHLKGMTTVCSVVAAGAVVGFIIVGRRFQQENWHLHQFHYFSVSSESMSRVVGLFSRLKDGLPRSQELRSLLPTRVLPQQPLST